MKKSEDDSTESDLSAGINAAERVLQKANEAVDRDLLDEALDNLMGRVDDWKNHRVEQFGKLLLHGVYTVITGKTDQEKDVSCTKTELFVDMFPHFADSCFYSSKTRTDPYCFTRLVRDILIRMYPAVLLSLIHI